ncbi:MAG: FkbM family methyltransferase [Bacteroidia bacterium]|nr:FkbM family methyltransferase [Bacteroidia bacterium]
MILGIPVDEVGDMLALEKVDWVKVDVEGSEVEVLMGAAQTLRTHKPQKLRLRRSTAIFRYSI